MLTYLWEARGGILVAAFVLLVVTLFVNWIAWIFRLGRFEQSGSPSPTPTLRFVVANFFAEIINDFRHFLALLIVLLFAVALFAAMYPGLSANDVGKLTDGLQAVAAALGGLIGSIMGYYFGESAASRKEADSNAPVPDASSPVQQPPAGNEPVSGIVPAPTPPTPPAGD